MTEQQNSQLLPRLFEQITEEQRVTVLHIGPALPETVDFFSNYRCKLFFVDLFAELPLVFDTEDELTVEQRLEELLDFPDDCRFDLCLFWDVFNYLDDRAVAAVMDTLRPHLDAHTLAHAFGVHNTRSPQRDQLFAIERPDALRVRSRREVLRGYAPMPQSRLKAVLEGFRLERSVLLADGRLELLLAAGGPPAKPNR